MGRRVTSLPKVTSRDFRIRIRKKHGIKRDVCRVLGPATSYYNAEILDDSDKGSKSKEGLSSKSDEPCGTCAFQPLMLVGWYNPMTLLKRLCAKVYLPRVVWVKACKPKAGHKDKSEGKSDKETEEDKLPSEATKEDLGNESEVDVHHVASKSRRHQVYNFDYSQNEQYDATDNEDVLIEKLRNELEHFQKEAKDLDLPDLEFRAIKLQNILNCCNTSSPKKKGTKCKVLSAILMDIECFKRQFNRMATDKQACKCAIQNALIGKFMEDKNCKSGPGKGNKPGKNDASEPKSLGGPKEEEAFIASEISTTPPNKDRKRQFEEESYQTNIDDCDDNSEVERKGKANTAGSLKAGKGGGFENQIKKGNSATVNKVEQQQPGGQTQSIQNNKRPGTPDKGSGNVPGQKSSNKVDSKKGNPGGGGSPGGGGGSPGEGGPPGEGGHTGGGGAGGGYPGGAGGGNPGGVGGGNPGGGHPGGAGGGYPGGAGGGNPGGVPPGGGGENYPGGGNYPRDCGPPVGEPPHINEGDVMKKDGRYGGFMVGGENGNQQRRYDCNGNYGGQTGRGENGFSCGIFSNGNEDGAGGSCYNSNAQGLCCPDDAMIDGDGCGPYQSGGVAGQPNRNASSTDGDTMCQPNGGGVGYGPNRKDTFYVDGYGNGYPGAVSTGGQPCRGTLPYSDNGFSGAAPGYQSGGGGSCFPDGFSGVAPGDQSGGCDNFPGGAQLYEGQSGGCGNGYSGGTLPYGGQPGECGNGFSNGTLPYGSQPGGGRNGFPGGAQAYGGGRMSQPGSEASPMYGGKTNHPGQPNGYPTNGKDNFYMVERIENAGMGRGTGSMGGANRGGNVHFSKEAGGGRPGDGGRYGVGGMNGVCIGYAGDERAQGYGQNPNTQNGQQNGGHQGACINRSKKGSSEFETSQNPRIPLTCNNQGPNKDQCLSCLAKVSGTEKCKDTDLQGDDNTSNKQALEGGETTCRNVTDQTTAFGEVLCKCGCKCKPKHGKKCKEFKVIPNPCYCPSAKSDLSRNDSIISISVIEILAQPVNVEEVITPLTENMPQLPTKNVSDARTSYDSILLKCNNAKESTSKKSEAHEKHVKILTGPKDYHTYPQHGRHQRHLAHTSKDYDPHSNQQKMKNKI